MPATWFYALASVTLVSLISLIGIATISISEQRLRKMIFVLVSLAAGGLFGDAFIHLVPQSFGRLEGRALSSVLVIAGIVAFFILEKFLRWRHAHALTDYNRIEPVGYINLVADGAHNFIDGMLIGASYAASLPVGLATTVAVILHEIPQEIGDFGILLHAGFSRREALWFNFLSASLAVLGAVISLLVSAGSEHFWQTMLPLTAGGFIYIAGSDLLPELQKELNPSRSALQLAAIIAGVGLMLLLTLLE